MEYGYAFRTSHHPPRDSKETNAAARMNAPPSRSIFRSHATRGASATLFALALVFFRRIHAAEREAVRATRFNARDFCEQTSTRELEPWNDHKKVCLSACSHPLARAKKQTFLGFSTASWRMRKMRNSTIPIGSCVSTSSVSTSKPKAYY